MMRIAFTAAHKPIAQKALSALTKIYGQCSLKTTDYVVALGGDGHVLNTLHSVISLDKPVFAMRRTESVGFLCNNFRSGGLQKRLAEAQRIILYPLLLEARTERGIKKTALAINEISVIRETPQSAHLRIKVDGIERIQHFSGDGVLVATPTGSTAYNHSCGGPIMPIDANTLVMTAISGYRPRRWTYAVLPQDSMIEIDVMDIAKRPVRIEAGLDVIANATSAKIRLDRKQSFTLLFDPGQHLGERIVREQFML